MKLKNLLFTMCFGLMLFLGSANLAQSQGIITGKVVDSELNQALPGATVNLKGTSEGISTDLDGSFSLQVSQNSGTLEISFLGYLIKNVPFALINGKVDLETITLQPNPQQLEGVVVVGVADIAKDRETPVAVSTIRASEIRTKLGSQEFPEILRSTPSVYVTKQGGGFGDSRINVRGFNQRNTAVMINGVPINDMENGWVYWSNWAGLSDVTSAMQVQRGLGSSKLAISSVGGTINVLTKSSTFSQGGSVMASTGNDGYLKFSGSYNSGLLDNGFSASVLFSTTRGDGYVGGTKFEGYNYYIALGYKPNKQHDLQFTYTGAPQWHNQHSRAVSLESRIQYGEDGDPNRKYNEDWGYLNGEEYSWRRNFYHKPVMSLNWDWNISDNSTLSTVAYASWGRGGGSGPIGRINGDAEFRLARTADGLYDFDKIVAWNQGEDVPEYGDPRNPADDPSDDGLITNSRNLGLSRRASMNSHNWYGTVINFNHKLNEKWNFDIGADLRTYKGIHYRVVNDVLGADNYYDNRDMNNLNRIIQPADFVEVSPSLNPWANITDQKKIEYYNDGLVNWLGAFGQLEYSDGTVSAFVQGGFSSQGFKRIDYFNQPTGSQETEWENLLGGNIKAGVNYNIDANHNVFANAGYYSKQPLFDGVWINNSNTLNPNLTNETIIGTELGYGYRSAVFNANVNVYRTSWKDRYLSVGTDLDVNGTPTDEDDDIRGTANLNGVEQIHTGIETDFVVRPSSKFKINGMLSIGNWEYASDVTANYVDENDDVIIDPDTNEPFKETLYLDEVKVGDAAQFTAFLGADYEIIKNFSIDAGMFFANQLFASIDVTDFNTPDHLGSLELPSYTLVDAGLSYKLLLGEADDQSLNLRLNVNNVLDKLYISESATNDHMVANDEGKMPASWEGINQSNRVYMGFGRTWNVSLRYNF